MSSLSRNIRYFKTLLNQGSDLLLLRLRLLALDLNAQAGDALKIMGAIVFAAVMALLALVSLLFGLDSVLGAQAKIWVFFGITVVAMLAAAGLLMWSAATWRNRGGQVAATLRDMQQDIAYLRGQTGAVSDTEKEEHNEHDK
ncbi:MAG: phage holin family protein [Neisseria sp.]|nr:phage holin family protein [Neisseria sp.]